MHHNIDIFIAAVARLPCEHHSKLKRHFLKNLAPI